MSLRMPVGNLIYRDVDMSSILTGIVDVKNALNDAGWEDVSELNEKYDIHYFGNLGDGNTLTIGATTYTFRTTPSLTFDIQIGATVTITRDNTITKINAVDPLVTAHPGAIFNVAATDKLYLVNDLGGVHMDIVISRVGSNIVLNGPWMEGGYLLFSVTAAGQLLRAGVELSTNGVDVRWRCCPVDQSAFGTYFFWDVLALRTLKISADGQQFFTWLLGSSAAPGCVAHMCVPFVFEGMEPLLITGIADNGSGLFRVTFASDHGMGDGQNIYIDQATSSGAYSTLNGGWQVTVVSSTVLDLDDSVYVAGYDTGSGLGATYKRHSRLFFATGCGDVAGDGITFRDNLEARSFIDQRIDQTLCCDGSFYNFTRINVNGVSNLSMYVLKTPVSHVMSKVAAIGNLDAAMTPLVGWAWPTEADPRYLMGQVPRGLIVQDDIDADQTFVHADYNWICYTDNHDNGSFILTLTAAA